MKTLITALTAAFLLSGAAAAQEFDSKAVGPAIRNALGAGVSACLSDERCRELATRSTTDIVNRGLQACAQPGDACRDMARNALQFLSQAYAKR